jgi:hypothetical protein
MLSGTGPMFKYSACDRMNPLMLSPVTIVTVFLSAGAPPR